jgi:hypothetical protein
VSGTRRKPGPLGPYVDGYRVRLLELGYSPVSVTRPLTALGYLGRWMERQDVDVERLTDGVLKMFLADHVDEHGHLPSAGVMPLLDYLRDEGLVPPEPARQLAPLGRFLDKYRDWLLSSGRSRLTRSAVTPGWRTASSRNASRPRTSSGWKGSRARM